MNSEKEWKNINRVKKLNDSTTAYCWSDLYSVAAEHISGRVSADTAEELKEAARSTARCHEDAKVSGSCYCGKFKREVANETEA